MIMKRTYPKIKEKIFGVFFLEGNEEIHAPHCGHEKIYGLSKPSIFGRTTIDYYSGLVND
jgi:hypothetical protein